MGAAFEIIEDAQPNSPMGSFRPQADQTKFRSVFAHVAGKREKGWPTQRDVETGIPTQDGKGRLRFTEFKDGQKPNVVRMGDQELREFVTPLEDAMAKEKYDAGISNAVVANYMTPTNTPATDSRVGRASVGEQQIIQTTVS